MPREVPGPKSPGVNPVDHPGATGTRHGPAAAISAAVSMRTPLQPCTGASVGTLLRTGRAGRGVGHTGRFQTPRKRISCGNSIIAAGNAERFGSRLLWYHINHAAK